jgi:hypothetical protein
LLAHDAAEANAIVERHLHEHSLDEALQLLLDALLALKRDLQAARISADDGELVLSGLRASIEELRTADGAAPDQAAAEPPVLVIGAPGRDPLDAVVLELARVLLRGEPVTLEVLSMDLMTGEALAEIESRAPAAVVVASLPPAGLTPARQLCMRAHARLPELPIVAARLGDPESEIAGRVALLETAGCEEVATSLGALKTALQRIARSRPRDAAVAATPRAAAGRRG